MKRNVLLAALVVLGALPVVAAQSSTNSPEASSVDPASAAAVDAAAESSSSASGSATANDDAASWNYTRLYVDADQGYFDVKPGESKEFEVTVENGEDETVTVDPHLYVPPVTENPLKDAWVDVEGDTSIAAGAEETYTVTVAVPEAATTGNYRGMIAFTDEKVTYPGRPPQPVHAANVGVEVRREPTVQILSETYVHAQVEAGDSVTHEIRVKNTGDSAVPLNPERASERGHCRGSGCPLELDPAWLDIDAPSEIAPGETATVSITMSPAADAERGRYNTEMNLGLKDPARPEHDTYWQRIDLSYVVWKQPEKPFETTVDVSERADNLTLTLTPQAHRYGANDDTEPASFDVQFVNPDGETVDARRVRVSDSGSVDLSGRSRRTAATSDGDYTVHDGGKEFVYRVDDPEAGEWTVAVTPHNAIGFGYELVRHESSDDGADESGANGGATARASA